ncbi:hypothetical protein A3Q56_04214 [Intoshia linei]|uniref:Uncharacterized protein n=1 Tax=Intoshia linei TaxID=1819745 RepID=A0A177B1Q5_9BILA|nr:hypothetical protein A3Q56_04214 [Intoshia linei]
MLYVLPKLYGWGNNTLIQAGKEEYNLNNMEKLFNDLNDSESYLRYTSIIKYVQYYPPRNVTTHCIYSYGIKTTNKIIFKSKKFTKIKRIEYGDGDGTVNLVSLSFCKKSKNPNLLYKLFKKKPHIDIIKSKKFIDYIIEHTQFHTQN